MAIPKIDALTGLRFFAAAGIVIYHLPDIPSYSPEIWGGWAGSLGQGVSVFFVLSGFILSTVYPDLKGSGQLQRFFIARFARLWPVHAVMLLLFVIAFGSNPAAGIAGEHVAPFLANLTLTHAFFPFSSFYFSYNGVSWSISTEFGFYLLFPFIIANISSTWHWKLALALLCSLSMALIAQGLGLGRFDPQSAAMTYEGLVYFSPLGRVFEFTLGVVTAHLFRQIKTHKAVASGNIVVWTGLELFGVWLVIFNITLASKALAFFGLKLSEQMEYWVFMASSPAIPTAILVLALASQRGLVSKFLALPTVRWLGEISFALYLVHQPIIRYVGRNQDVFGAWAVPVAVVSALIAAVVLWQFVEKPMRKVIIGLPLFTRFALGPKPA